MRESHGHVVKVIAAGRGPLKGSLPPFEFRRDEASGGGNVARNNCLWAGREGNVDREGGGFGTQGNIAANPLFVNRARRDYRLSPRSRCRRVVGFDAAALIRRARPG